MMDLNDLTLLDFKAIGSTTWLEDTQVKVEHCQMLKLVPKESISIKFEQGNLPTQKPKQNMKN